MTPGYIEAVNEFERLLQEWDAVVTQFCADHPEGIDILAGRAARYKIDRSAEMEMDELVCSHLGLHFEGRRRADEVTGRYLAVYAPLPSGLKTDEDAEIQEIFEYIAEKWWDEDAVWSPEDRAMEFRLNVHKWRKFVYSVKLGFPYNVFCFEDYENDLSVRCALQSALDEGFIPNSELQEQLRQADDEYRTLLIPLSQPIYPDAKPHEFWLHGMPDNKFNGTGDCDPDDITYTEYAYATLGGRKS